jgi:hypothetical protein
MRLVWLGLSLAGIVAAVPSADVGLKIVARETDSAYVVETIEYIESERARVESRMVPAPSRAAGKPLAQDVQGHRSARISRCDLQKLILLNYDDRTYMTAPLRASPGTARKLLASLPSGRTPEPKAPNLLIETTTVQTGERKHAFGHTARRVITTRRHIPLDATGGAPGETETDGWYIDLETRPSCDRLEAIGVRAVLLVGKASSDAARPPEAPTVTFKDIGAPERGYPIEVRTTSRSMEISANGTSSEHTFVTHKVVMQLSTEALDPALFEIPAGFLPAEGRLAAFAAYSSLAWQTVKALVAAFFR